MNSSPKEDNRYEQGCSHNYEMMKNLLPVTSINQVVLLSMK